LIAGRSAQEYNQRKVVTHPSNWAHSGYREIHNLPKRYGIIDGFSEVADFQQAHRDW
jgi:hypothetical protein